MKILVYGEFYEESFAEHISFSLEKMNYEVFKFPHLSEKVAVKLLGNTALTKFYYLNKDLLSSNLRIFRKKRLKNLLNHIRDSKPDLIITTYDYLWAEEVEVIKNTFNLKIVIWSPDSIASIAAGKSHFLNASYDALFFKDPYIIKNLSQILGLNAFYLPECFNPHKHVYDKKYNLSEYSCDITTAGNLHSYRVAFFKQLLDKNYDIKIWGIDSPHWLSAGKVAETFQGRSVYNHEKAAAFLGSKIVVNNLLLSEIEGVNVRTFEIAGIGGFQLVDWREGIKDLFELENEIDTFKTMDELKEKIDYYLPRPEERDLIRKNAKKRAIKDHTYETRLSLLIDTVFNGKKGYIFY